MFFKKFRQGIDMRKNKIINSFVDNPVTDNEIANKNYVDLGDKYDTNLAITKQNSTKFPWVTSLANNDIKQVLDKLLFANVNPVYKNPELLSFKFYNTGLKNNVIGGNINGYLQYQVNNNDRTPTVNYKLIVVYNDNTQINFDDTDNNGEITFNFIWSNIKHIKLTQIFSPVTWRNDSNEQPYVDSNFATTYSFEYFFDLNQIIDLFNITKSIYYKTNINSTSLAQYLMANEVTLKSDFTNSNLINLNTQATTITDTLNNTLLLIHESLLNKTCSLFFKNDNKIISTLVISISEKIYYTNNIENKVQFNDGFYYFALINFGKYSSNTQVLIAF